MNLYSIISAAAAAFIVSYSIYLIYKHGKKLSPSSGIIICLVISGFTGLLAGFLTGINSGDLFLASGVSVIIGVMSGFLSGQRLGIIEILSGSFSGIISGLIGTILGILLQYTSPEVMLTILLALFALLCGLVILFITVETKAHLTFDLKGISPFTILLTGIALLALFLFLYSSDLVKVTGNDDAAATQSSPDQKSPETEIDVSKQTAPVVKMKVTETGYKPNIIRVKQGSTVTLEINNRLQDSCLSTFELPDFKINNAPLKIGTTQLTFSADKKGKFIFSCGMQMFKGTVIVE